MLIKMSIEDINFEIERNKIFIKSEKNKIENIEKNQELSEETKSLALKLSRKIIEDTEIQNKLYKIKIKLLSDKIIFNKDDMHYRSFRGYFSKPLERSDVIGFSLAFPDDTNTYEIFLIDKSDNMIKKKIKYVLYFRPPMRFYCEICLINYIIQLAQLTGAMTGKKYKCDMHLTKFN